jgi:hypothetical protein
VPGVSGRGLRLGDRLGAVLGPPAAKL